MRALALGAVLYAGVVAGFANQAASAAELSLQPPSPPRWSDWVPMFGDFLGTTRIDSAIGILRGAFKISENESPRPTDRIFFNYNYYNNVFPNSTGGGFDVHREVFGFEKTFLDGNASFGVRLPFLQFSEQDGGQTGDLSLLFKYAFINTPSTVVSGGLVVSLPTGTLPLGFDFAANRDIHSTAFQPFVGFQHNFTPDFFMQGFSSIAVPTDSRDVTMLYNSIGAGFWVYRGPATNPISGLVPLIEVHVNTPLDKRDAGFPDPLETTVNLTGGLRIQIFGQASLGIAVGVPIAGPKLYDVEGLAQFNLRF